jgi:hypothetical protein
MNQSVLKTGHVALVRNRRVCRKCCSICWKAAFLEIHHGVTQVCRRAQESVTQAKSTNNAANGVGISPQKSAALGAMCPRLTSTKETLQIGRIVKQKVLP